MKNMLSEHIKITPSIKDGNNDFTIKICPKKTFSKAKPKKEDIININEINIQDLRDKGAVAETEAEAMGLLTKDRLTAKGNPINLSQTLPNIQEKSK